MLLGFEQWGGTKPKIIDPLLLPPNRAQIALNCRFDKGGISALAQDTAVQALQAGDQKIFVYYNGGVKYYFEWDSDVDALKPALANDSFNRIFYTEAGILKVTDSSLFNAGTPYPYSYYYPCPPAPMDAPFISGTPSGTDPTLIETRGYVYTYVNGYGSEGPPSPVSNLLDIYDTNAVSIVGIGAVIDAYTKLLLHLDNNVTDTGATGHTVTNTGVTFSNTVMKWGYSGYWDGVASQLSVGDHPDFDLSGGVWSYDEWVYYLPKATRKTLFYKATGPDDYMTLYISGGSSPLYSGHVHFEIWASGVNVVALTSPTIYVSGQTHIEVTENGDSYYLFVNGSVVATASSVSRPAIYSGSFYLGSDGTTNFYKGYRDEIRLSKGICRHTTTFTPSSTAYADATAENVDPLYNVISKRIYRLNQAVSTAQYQFVAEIPYTSTTFTDTIPDASLGEILASTEWDAAPTGIKGIIALANGALAGFVDNLLCFSVPKYPHAWPVSWQIPFERDIVALGCFGNTVVVLTQGQPYLAIADDPSNVALERVDPGFSCMSKRGKIQSGEITIYPCPEGLVAIGPNVASGLTFGSPNPVDDIITPEAWQTRYNPSTLVSFYWQGKYMGFYQVTGTTNYAGFIFDLKTKDLVDLDFVATAGYYDKTDGTLYLDIDDELYSFASSDELRTFNYKSPRKRFKPSNFRCMKVLANTYPVGVDITYPDLDFTDIHTLIESSEPVRTRKPGALVKSCEVRVYGQNEVTAVYLSTTLEELPI